MKLKHMVLIAITTAFLTVILSANGMSPDSEELVTKICQNKVIDAIPKDGATLDIMNCSLKNITREPVLIKSFTIRLSGLNNPQDIDRIWLMNTNYTRVSETPSFNNQEKTLIVKIMPGYQKLVAREEVNWVLKASFAGSQQEGRTYLLDIIEMDISPAREQEKSWKRFFSWMVW